MKHKFLLFAASGILVASCGTDETGEHETLTCEYELDAGSSTLWWYGEENAEHFHNGHIRITEGSLTAENDIPVSGEFTIDTKSIVAETEGYPEEKLRKLSDHLKDTSFLFVNKYPEVKVRTGKYANGKLNTTIEVMGAELVNDLPLEVTSSDKGMNIKGEFSVDFADTKMEYITVVNPETGQPGAKSVFKFKLDLNLIKK